MPGAVITAGEIPIIDVGVLTGAQANDRAALSGVASAVREACFGTGFFINPTPPEESARFLRE